MIIFTLQSVPTLHFNTNQIITIQTKSTIIFDIQEQERIFQYLI